MMTARLCARVSTERQKTLNRSPNSGTSLASRAGPSTASTSTTRLAARVTVSSSNRCSEMPASDASTC